MEVEVCTAKYSALARASGAIGSCRCLEATIALFLARVASSSAFFQLLPFGIVIRIGPIRVRCGLKRDESEMRKVSKFKTENKRPKH